MDTIAYPAWLFFALSRGLQTKAWSRSLQSCHYLSLLQLHLWPMWEVRLWRMRRKRKPLLAAWRLPWDMWRGGANREPLQPHRLSTSHWMYCQWEDWSWRVCGKTDHFPLLLCAVPTWPRVPSEWSHWRCWMCVSTLSLIIISLIQHRSIEFLIIVFKA